MKNALIAFAIVAALISTGVAGAVIYIEGHQQSGQSLGAPETNTITAAATSRTSVIVSGSASTLVIATSTNRHYAFICNMSTASYVFLDFGRNATEDNGISLDKVGTGANCYAIGPDNLYTGAVNAIASTTAAEVVASYAQ